MGKMKSWGLLQLWSTSKHVALAVGWHHQQDAHTSLPFLQDPVTLGTSFKGKSGAFLSLSLHLSCLESDSIKYSQWMVVFLKGWSTHSFGLHPEPFHHSSADGGQRQPQGFHRKFTGIERNRLYPFIFSFKGKEENLTLSVAFVQMFVSEASRYVITASFFVFKDMWWYSF